MRALRQQHRCLHCTFAVQCGATQPELIMFHSADSLAVACLRLLQAGRLFSQLRLCPSINPTPIGPHRQIRPQIAVIIFERSVHTYLVTWAFCQCQCICCVVDMGSVFEHNNTQLSVVRSDFMVTPCIACQLLPAMTPWSCCCDKCHCCRTFRSWGILPSSSKVLNKAAIMQC